MHKRNKRKANHLSLKSELHSRLTDVHLNKFGFRRKNTEYGDTQFKKGDLIINYNASSMRFEYDFNELDSEKVRTLSFITLREFVMFYKMLTGIRLK